MRYKNIFKKKKNIMECKLDENNLKQGYNRKYENVIKKKNKFR